MVAPSAIAGLPDRERAEERAHLDLYEDELLARGFTPEEARHEARIKFGNPRVKLEEVGVEPTGLVRCAAPRLVTRFAAFPPAGDSRSSSCWSSRWASARPPRSSRWWMPSSSAGCRSTGAIGSSGSHGLIFGTDRPNSPGSMPPTRRITVSGRTCSRRSRPCRRARSR